MYVCNMIQDHHVSLATRHSSLSDDESPDAATPREHGVMTSWSRPMVQ